MIASGADFPLDRIHEIFAAGKCIRVRSRQALTSALPAHCKLRYQAAQAPVLFNYSLLETQPQALLEN